MDQKKTGEEDVFFLTGPAASMVAAARKRDPASGQRILTQIKTELDHWASFIKSIPAGALRASTIHKMIDNFISQAVKEEISCRSGCAHCCHGPVHITEDEAKLLEEEIRLGCWVDKERFKRQASWEVDDYRKHPREDSRCGFLKPDNTCSVYANRPINCRKVLVSTPPEACHQDSGQEISLITAYRSEMVASAALDAGDGPSILAKRLVDE